MSISTTDPKTAKTVLSVSNVAAGYGGIEVISGIDLNVPRGSVVALLGPNGAGKTTLLRTIAGVIRKSSGQVAVNGTDVSALPPFRRQRQGLCFIPEGRGIYRNMTVRENICVQAERADWGHAVDRSVEAFPVLERLLRRKAGTLSGGEQQMLALARCYIHEPAVILADEVSMGLAPLIIDKVFESLERLRESGISLVLVEQYVDRALEVADAVYVMTRGRLQFAGLPDEVNRAELMSGYLGANDAPHVSADQNSPQEGE